MLRCPPSRINLTASDIAGFEQRFIARHSAHLVPANPSNVRLSPGPGRSTSLSFVPAEQNAARKRAASSSSGHAAHDDHTAERAGTYHAANCTEPREGTLAWTDQQGDRPHTAGIIGPTEMQQPPQPSLPNIDGAADLRAPHSPPVVRCGLLLASSSSPHAAVDGPNNPVDQTPIHREIKPHLLSSARARRRNGRTQTDQIPIDSPVEEEEAAHPSQIVASALAIPDLVLHSGIESSPTNPALDRGAPVFVPQTRFARATRPRAEVSGGLRLEPRWSSVDSTHSSLELRIRSSSERNSDLPPGSRHVARVPSESSLDNTLLSNDVENFSRRQRRRSRTTEHNGNAMIQPANLERYPLLRPPVAHRQSSRITTRNITPHVRLVSPSMTQLRVVTGTSLGEQSSRVRDGPPDADASSWEGRTLLRPLSPATLSNSQSTPHFSQQSIHPGRIYSRGSSLSWSRSASREGRVDQVPSTAGAAASSFSGERKTSRQSSKEGLDAAAEFLRMRNSPLDDLTERLSRLSSSRPRSVGRSWVEAPRGRPRVSLLTGDPFRPEPIPRPATTDPRVSQRPEPNAVSPSNRTEAPSETNTMVEDLVALSLALPPSSSLPSTPAVPSSPPCPSATQRSIHPTSSPDPGRQGYSSPPSCIKRKPVPSGPKTPKVTVYDDSKPPNTQPQTPADVGRSTRRVKARSETAVQQSPIVVRHVKISTPPVIPERYPHRYTYPPGAAQGYAGPAGNAAGPSAHRSNEHVENDLEGHLPGLEQDRRTWMSRQEGVNLDVTPPREGRFERYLS
ncbi:uncharacterized protein LTR77_001005 [Saxophila tyrrhenica]|uniref:Uncharacterized protein n=1 Tax=Saxophila tyrrhenica TaxID=1690608 RepID=A0AAV9PU42_9PEZI|nr:hypothetical protein LTR77_001005 [Saxophila tyrrhenica]